MGRGYREVIRPGYSQAWEAEFKKTFSSENVVDPGNGNGGSHATVGLVRKGVLGGTSFGGVSHERDVRIRFS
jgi:hypothetical protein